MLLRALPRGTTIRMPTVERRALASGAHIVDWQGWQSWQGVSPNAGAADEGHGVSRAFQTGGPAGWATDSQSGVLAVAGDRGMDCRQAPGGAGVPPGLALDTVGSPPRHSDGAAVCGPTTALQRGLAPPSQVAGEPPGGAPLGLGASLEAPFASPRGPLTPAILGPASLWPIVAHRGPSWSMAIVSSVSCASLSFLSSSLLSDCFTTLHPFSSLISPCGHLCVCVLGHLLCRPSSSFRFLCSPGSVLLCCQALSIFTSFLYVYVFSLVADDSRRSFVCLVSAEPGLNLFTSPALSGTGFVSFLVASPFLLACFIIIWQHLGGTKLFTLLISFTYCLRATPPFIRVSNRSVPTNIDP